MNATANPNLPPFKPTFEQIVSAFVFQGLIACGKLINPMSQRYETDLAMAQYHIGVIEVLRNKTQGNLSADEDRLLEDMLHQLRMAYVDASRNAPAEPSAVTPEGGAESAAAVQNQENPAPEDVKSSPEAEGVGEQEQA